MENIISFLASLEDSEVETMLIFLREYVKTRKIESKLEKFANVLKLQGVSQTQIQHDRICKLRALGVIDVDEELRRITELYNTH